MNLDIAKAILTKGKALVPDRFPQPSLEVAQVWAEALGTVNLPWQVWNDAVILWATELVRDRMCSPKDLRAAAFVVRDRWELIPEKRRILDENRLRTINANFAAAGHPPVPDSSYLYGAQEPAQLDSTQVLAETRRRAQNANQTRNPER